MTQSEATPQPITTAKLVYLSSYLTRYIDVPASIYTTNDDDNKITEVVWVYSRDEKTGEPTLAVILDVLNQVLLIAEADDYAFKEDVRFSLIGFANAHDLSWQYTGTSVLETGTDEDEEQLNETKQGMIH
jgi:hypothetical protein